MLHNATIDSINIIARYTIIITSPTIIYLSF